jgi:uncharacterized damage-inducible protein DinB
MTIAQFFIQQFQQEAAGTQKILERIPQDHFTWRPHQKSMTLGRLGMHIAELPRWVVRCVQHDSFSFGQDGYKPVVPETLEQIMETFHASLGEAMTALNETSDEAMRQNWKLMYRDMVLYDLPRTAVIGKELRHIVHHRGQLSVYLRMLDVPLPNLYGPTADER